MKITMTFDSRQSADALLNRLSEMKVLQDKVLENNGIVLVFEVESLIMVSWMYRYYHDVASVVEINMSKR